MDVLLPRTSSYSNSSSTSFTLSDNGEHSLPAVGASLESCLLTNAVGKYPSKIVYSPVLLPRTRDFSLLNFVFLTSLTRSGNEEHSLPAESRIGIPSQIPGYIQYGVQRKQTFRNLCRKPNLSAHPRRIVPTLDIAVELCFERRATGPLRWTARTAVPASDGDLERKSQTE